MGFSSDWCYEYATRFDVPSFTCSGDNKGYPKNVGSPRKSWKAFVRMDPVNVLAKFEVRSFTRSWDNWGYPKNWAVSRVVIWVKRSADTRQFHGGGPFHPLVWNDWPLINEYEVLKIAVRGRLCLIAAYYTSTRFMTVITYFFVRELKCLWPLTPNQKYIAICKTYFSWVAPWGEDKTFFDN